MNMTICSDIKGKILEGQKEAFKEANVQGEDLQGLDKKIEYKEDNAMYFSCRIWVPLWATTPEIIWFTSTTRNPRVEVGGDSYGLITNFPRTSSGHDSIWVIVDRLTKSVHFLAFRKDYQMEKLARLYINKLVA
uniref:Putative reverse transcriptase domain, ribonuclease H-like domain, aspartic peptidase domain protein n=1 Tax=Tanacetum cinerariifolium TaxID=118510 RepID=A0A699QC41_TANCI|nr:putative reverse transcriptase domain, ribonuclease H-like domain, aspartic peptidase domain protein [Tanacetum cinerariifolium]